MKKEYLTPNIEIVEVELRSIIATSITDDEAAPGSEESTVNFAPGMESGSDDLDW